MSFIASSKKDLLSTEKRIFGYDVIRFIAIFYVFWGHGAILIPNELKEIYSWGTFLPLEGVSIFFVLSGFLIGNILLRTIQKTNFNLKELSNFWFRRWYRTLPNYYVVLFILLLTGAKSENFDLRFLIFTQSFSGDHPDFFNPTWSLAVEEWFYTLFPLILFLSLLGIRKLKTSLFLSISIFILVPLALRFFNHFNPDFLEISSTPRKITIFRFDSMMFGILAAYIYSKHKEFWIEKAKFFTIAGIASLVVIIFVKKYSNLYQTEIFENVFVYYFESIPIFFFLPFFSSLKSIKFKKLEKFIVVMSKLSYSIYLVHGSLVLWFILRNLESNNTFIEIRFEFQRVILFILYIVLSIIFSLFLYVFLEKPIMNYRDKITKHY
ncbi:MAG: hypothetical protein CMD20_03965 [Flavobacteriales bacterium]|nr:hypothetical protein [Flavobacteriales bacterium]